MNKNISWKKSLLVSGTAMLLCGAMLAGTTFAWFTSTAASGENTITAGNLSVELQYDVQGNGTWVSSEDPSAESYKIFDKSWQWEPGMLVASKPFRIANTGDRALKYEVTVKATDTVKAGEHGLSEVIESVVVEANQVDGLINAIQGGTYSRDQAWETFTSGTGRPTTNILSVGTGEDSHAELVVLLYWKPNAELDQYFNVEDLGVDNTNAPKTTYQIDVYATQANVETEKDGVDEHYDKGAPLGPAAATSESVEIYGAIDNGTTQIDHFATALFEDIQDPKYADDLKSTPVSGSLSISPLEYNAAEEKYEATISFKDATNGLVLIGVPGIVGLIHNAVAQHKEAIDTITIAGTEVPADVIDKLEPLPNDGSTIDFAGATLQDVLSNHSETSTGAGWLFMPLATWGADGGDVMEFAISLYTGDLSGLNDRACDVVITDKEGNSVTYSLAFKVT